MRKTQFCRELIPFPQNYPWGKKGKDSLVARLISTIEDTYFAELWIGNHPSGICKILMDDQESMNIGDWMKSSEGVAFMGESRKQTLPFLMKVLSIGRALSIQSHPDKKTAERLHREQPHIYKDDNHKPEIAIPLTDFVALCGFRRVNDIRSLINSLRSISLIGRIMACLSDQSSSEELLLKEAYKTLMYASTDDISGVVLAVQKKISLNTVPLKNGKFHDTQINDSYVADDTATKLSGNVTENEIWQMILILNEQYPGGDVGVLSPLFINILKMKGITKAETEGGAIRYLSIPANCPHAYISGDIIECMSCSDNVIRGGLTTKHKDLTLLLDTLDFTPHSLNEYIKIPEDNFHEDSHLKRERIVQTWKPGNGVVDFTVHSIMGDCTLKMPTSCLATSVVYSGEATITLYSEEDKIFDNTLSCSTSTGKCYAIKAGCHLKVTESTHDFVMFVASKQ